MHHAIETVHVRRRKRYVLRRVVGSFAAPVEAVGKSYATETEARRAAERLGLTIFAVGDLYQIRRTRAYQKIADGENAEGGRLNESRPDACG